MWAAYISGGFGLAINAMLAFIVPLRARELGASYEVIGIIVGAAALMPMFLSVPLGAVIVRLGSKRSFMLGTGFAGIVSLGFLAVHHYWWLLPLQLMLGIGRMLGWIGSQSHVSNLGSAGKRSAQTGKWSFFSNFGPMVATLLIGGASDLLGFRLAFAVMAAYSFVFCALGLLMRELDDGEEAVPGRKRSTGFREALPMLGVPGVQTALPLTFARILVERLWMSFAPVLLVGAGVSAGLASTVVFTKTVVSTGTAPTAGIWTRRASAATVLMIALCCGLVGLSATPFLLSIPAAYGTAVLIGISHGLSLPLLLTLVADAIPQAQRPIALGLRGTANQTASTTMPALGGALIAALGATAALPVLSGLGLGLVAMAAFSARRIPALNADGTQAG